MKLLQEIRTIAGWLSPSEAMLLFNLAKANTYNGLIVEIGSWKGKSTVCLGRGSQQGNRNKIVAIDPHSAPADKLKNYLKPEESSTFKEFSENIKKAELSDMIEPIVDFSYNAIHKINQPIDLIFIDGSHEYEHVLQDLALYFPKVREGGVIAFHDTTGGGPKRVMLEQVYYSNHFKSVRFVDSITYGVKVSQNTFVERLQNRYRAILFHIFTTYRTKNMPQPLKEVGKLFYRLLR